MMQRQELPSHINAFSFLHWLLVLILFMSSSIHNKRWMAWSFDTDLNESLKTLFIFSTNASLRFLENSLASQYSHTILRSL
jgi:hypothetical protein